MIFLVCSVKRLISSAAARCVWRLKAKAKDIPFLAIPTRLTRDTLYHSAKHADFCSNKRVFSFTRKYLSYQPFFSPAYQPIPFERQQTLPCYIRCFQLITIVTATLCLRTTDTRSQNHQRCFSLVACLDSSTTMSDSYNETPDNSQSLGMFLGI